MSWFTFLITLLAVWRITHLMQAEDGPFDLIFKLRQFAGDSFIGKLMDCFYCLSIWVAVLPGFYFGNGWIEKITLWLAFSGGAILLEKLTDKGQRAH